MESNSQDKKVVSRSQWIVKTGYVTLGCIGGLLFLSLLMTFTATYKQVANQHKTVQLPSDLALDIVYPNYLLVAAPGNPLMVNLTVNNATGLTGPLTVTLNLPASIVLSGTASQEWVFEEENGRYQQAAFPIQNAGILHGIVPASPAQTLRLSHSLASDSIPLSIHVETAAAAAIRQFFTSLLQDKSPLLLTLIVLLPVASLILQYVQKQEERETNERQLQETHRKTVFDQQVKQLYRYLVQVNREDVQDTWQQITQSPLKDTLSAREQERLERLSHLATGHVTEPDRKTEAWIKANQNEWTSELVGALLCAEDAVKTQAAFYKPIFYDVPLEKIADLSLRNQLIRLWRKIEDPFVLQANAQKIIPQRDTRQESLLDRLPNLRLVKRDPFLHTQAEDEEKSLLEQEGFWFRHPVCDAVDKAVRVQVVYGPPGCGRTALAKFLAYSNPHASSPYFWHYEQLHENLTDFSGLRYYLAQQLLNYITSKPTLLQSVQESQRQMLANTLVEELTKQFVSAQIETALDNEVWTKQATEYQKPIWLKVSAPQLVLLAQAVETAPTATRMTDTQWMNTLVKAFNLFDFSGVRLLLDCEPEAAEGIIPRIPTLQEWQRFGLITTLFMPGGDVNFAFASKLPLDWTKAQLEQMFAHRFKQLAENHLPPAELFRDESVYNSFLELAADQTIPLPPTPRKLAQLWQAALENVGEKERIDLDVLEQAKRMMLRWLEETRLSSSERPINPKRLADLFDETFNDNELRSLCFALDEDYDNIGGQTKRNKIEELVQKLNRQGRLPELMEQYRHLRPKRAWQ